jgi:hypothetical protein
MLNGRRAKERAQEEAEAAHRQAEAERAAAEQRAHEVLAAQINEAIVHTIGAQQALVRGAHPDDVLQRLQAAEDSAREALSDLAQLTAMIGR